MDWSTEAPAKPSSGSTLCREIRARDYAWASERTIWNSTFFFDRQPQRQAQRWWRVARLCASKGASKRQTFFELHKQTGLRPWLDGRRGGTPCFLTETVDGETFVQMRIVLDTRIHMNAPGHGAPAFGLPMRTTGVFRAVVSRYPKPLTLLFALIMLAFATATLQAQSRAAMQLQEFNTAVQPASRFETDRQPVITIVDRAGLIGNEGPHAVTIETNRRAGSGICGLGRNNPCFSSKLPFAQRQGRFLLRFVDSRARSAIHFAQLRNLGVDQLLGLFTQDTAYQCGIPWCRGGGRQKGVRSARSACGIAANPRTGGTLPTFPCCRAFLLLDRTAATGKEKRKGERRG